LGPRLTVKSTGALWAITVPRFGLEPATRPALKTAEYAFRTTPTVQWLLMSSALAPESVRPTTIGTLQAGGSFTVAGPLVMYVITDDPEPTVTVALPEAGLTEASVLPPPATAIDVTADPAGTFSVTINTTPSG
jgi:hypothetical protein